MVVTAFSPVKKSASSTHARLDVNQQMKEEVGDDTLTEPFKLMLQQKYGIVPPQFTPLERNLILQEERRNRLFPTAA